MVRRNKGQDNHSISENYEVTFEDGCQITLKGTKKALITKISPIFTEFEMDNSLLN